MVNMTEQKVRIVSINKAENGFMLAVITDPSLIPPPDSMSELDMNRWHAQNDFNMNQNPAKTYVFSDLDSLFDFIRIKTGWN